MVCWPHHNNKKISVWVGKKRSFISSLPLFENDDHYQRVQSSGSGAPDCLQYWRTPTSCARETAHGDLIWSGKGFEMSEKPAEGTPSGEFCFCRIRSLFRSGHFLIVLCFWLC